MSERTNESALLAARLLGAKSPEDLNPKVIEAAKVYALLALAVEVSELREELAAELGPAGTLASFLDEVAIRLAPNDDSIAEAIVGLRGGESE